MNRKTLLLVVGVVITFFLVVLFLGYLSLQPCSTLNEGRCKKNILCEPVRGGGNDSGKVRPAVIYSYYLSCKSVFKK